jgi:hypothetical protein
MPDLFDMGAARHADPKTSKDAAALVNVPRLEQRVLDVLEHGPATAEEISFWTKIHLQSITPRLKPLLDKCRIEAVLDDLGRPATKTAKSGRQRQVYRIQRDESLWRERPEYKTKSAVRIEKLEAALREIRDIANVSEGVEFYAMLATKALEK